MKNEINSKKFNVFQYRGVDRIEVKVPRLNRITARYVWNTFLKKYEAPLFGKRYRAGKYEWDSKKNKMVRRFQLFEKVDDAVLWQNRENKSAVRFSNDVAKKGELLDARSNESHQMCDPLFKDIVQEWKTRLYPTYWVTTVIKYDKYLRIYFDSLMDSTIYEITPQRVDEWLDEIKELTQKKNRVSFKDELKVLKTILSYYDEYHDDPAFHHPIKGRHQKAVKLKNKRKSAQKHMSVENFYLFREELKKGKYGLLYSTMATCQYFQALRISEQAALYIDDIEFVKHDPSDSRLLIRRSVVWPRKKGMRSFVDVGFKNSEANKGIKEQPLFPETYRVLNTYCGDRSRIREDGLIFHIDGKHLEYRQIQYAYDKAFKAAKLPYRGTHVMRYGGCSDLYNRVPDQEVAKQLLGNTSLGSIRPYAVRRTTALTEVVKAQWDDEIS